MKNVLLAATAIAMFVPSTSSAGWDPIKDIKKLGRKIDEGITQPIRRGAEDVAEGAVDVVEGAGKVAGAVIGVSIVADLVQGDSLDEALSESVHDLREGPVRAIDGIVSGNQAMLGTTVDIVDGTLGDFAGDVAGVLVLPTAVVNASASAAAHYADDVLQGGDAGEIRGLPLATAIRQAHAYYDGKAKPLPDDVKTLLASTGVIPQSVLDRARYIVDNDGSTVASIINDLTLKFGSKTDINHAVTIDNIIVFAKEPRRLEDIGFWAHEIHHVAQYKQLGIEGFAADYTVRWEAMEADADNVAAQVVEKISAFLIAAGISVQSAS